LITIKGHFNSAVVFTKKVEQKAIDQIRTLCDQEFTKGSKIRVMPDVHLGKGSTIGTTMTIEDKVVPNLVGVDIGCGLEVVKLKEKNLDLRELDAFIYRAIPSGFKIRDSVHPFIEQINLNKLRSKKHLKINRAEKSLGTLGGGNHFIEVNKDSEDNLYLVIHSGSRHIGLEVANHYQKLAGKGPLAYLEGKGFNDYIHDMKIIQKYAQLNRKSMIHEIVKAFNLNIVEQFTTIHNYIDTDSMILRKGAVSAKKGEKLIIPLNMREGSLICIGKGIKEWNYSTCHGAGRVMSRNEAKKTLNLKTFRTMMEGVYTTSVGKGTLDESPEVYKPSNQIIEDIKPSVDIIEQIKPIYNFKAAN